MFVGEARAYPRVEHLKGAVKSFKTLTSETYYGFVYWVVHIAVLYPKILTSTQTL
jgi:hypothetical protein